MPSAPEVYLEKIWAILTDSDGSIIDFSAVIVEYATNDLVEASPTITYIGKENPDARWLVMRMDTSSGTSIRYASLVNNPTVATYAAAWAARATTLVYGTYAEAL